METSCQLHDPADLPAGKESSTTHWIGDCMGPIGDLDAVKVKKCLAPTGNRIPVPRSFNSLYSLQHQNFFRDLSSC
jgi:hypothetical protein